MLPRFTELETQRSNLSKVTPKQRLTQDWKSVLCGSKPRAFSCSLSCFTPFLWHTHSLSGSFFVSLFNQGSNGPSSCREFRLYLRECFAPPGLWRWSINDHPRLWSLLRSGCSWCLVPTNTEKKASQRGVCVPLGHLRDDRWVGWTCLTLVCLVGHKGTLTPTQTRRCSTRNVLLWVLLLCMLARCPSFPPALMQQSLKVEIPCQCPGCSSICRTESPLCGLLQGRSSCGYSGPALTQPSLTLESTSTGPWWTRTSLWLPASSASSRSPASLSPETGSIW